MALRGGLGREIAEGFDSAPFTQRGRKSFSLPMMQLCAHDTCLPKVVRRCVCEIFNQFQRYPMVISWIAQRTRFDGLYEERELKSNVCFPWLALL